jgi:predicted transcriptional regulator of viral defense system
VIDLPSDRRSLSSSSAQEFLPMQTGSQEDSSAFGNRIERTSKIVSPYYLGLSTAASYYGLSTQQYNEIFLLTTAHVQKYQPNEDRIRIVHQASNKFFGYQVVNMLGRNVMISDCEKTAIDCIDYLTLIGDAKEAGNILTTASQRFDWIKTVGYLEQIGSMSLVRRFGWFVAYYEVEIPPYIYENLIRLAGLSFEAVPSLELGRANSTEAENSSNHVEPWRLWLQPSQRPARSSLRSRRYY